MAEPQDRGSAATCDGSSECKAERHLHGCYSDDGSNCDHPSEHRPRDEFTTFRPDPEVEPDPNAPPLRIGRPVPERPWVSRAIKPEPPVATPDHAVRLTEWANDAEHIVQSVRSHEPTYPNPAALRRDVRALLAERQQDKQRIARYEKALNEIAWLIGTSLPHARRLDRDEMQATARAALAGEEDAANG